MLIDILTRNDIPHSYENYAASRLGAQLARRNVRYRHIHRLDRYFHEVRDERPDWTIAFEELLPCKRPLCDILALPHFHWERKALCGLEHLKSSPHCTIGFHEPVAGVYLLPLPAERVAPQPKQFDSVLFLDLTEEKRSLVEGFDSRIDIFGHHQCVNWLATLKNRHLVHLHMAVPFSEQLRILAMSRFVVMEPSGVLAPFAILADCLPVAAPVSEKDRLEKLALLTRRVVEENSWERSTDVLLSWSLH